MPTGDVVGRGRWRRDDVGCLLYGRAGHADPPVVFRKFKLSKAGLFQEGGELSYEFAVNVVRQKGLRVRSGTIKYPRHTIEGQDIALGSKPYDDSFGDGGNIGSVAEAFAPVDVRNMHLDHGHVRHAQSIVNSDGGMCVGACIDDDPGRAATRLLDNRDQLTFEVGLPKICVQPKCCRMIGTHGIDIIQCLGPVEFRLPGSKHVQIWAIENKYFRAFGHYARLHLGFEGYITPSG